MDSVEIPLVTSDIEARHEGHEFDAFGAIGIPHMQQSTFTIVPPVRDIVASSISNGIAIVDDSY